MNLFTPDDAYKVLVVGPQLAGKTSYIGQYVYGDFNSAYKTTIGGKVILCMYKTLLFKFHCY